MTANTSAVGYGEVVVGQYNIAAGNASTWVQTDPLFIIGNGTDASHTSNAFVVDKQGDATVSGALTAGNATISGNTTVGGTLNTTNIVASGTTHIAPQGDLSMGTFTVGQ